MIKTIIFDLGMVIVNYDHSRIINQIEQKSKLGKIEIQEHIFKNQSYGEYEIGAINSQEFYERSKKIFDFQMTFDEFAQAWNSTFDLEPILSEKYIKGLSAKYRLIALSDTNELHFNFIRKNFPLMNYFDDFVLSYKVRFLKPSPEIYAAAIKKANCAAEECLFTDDREANVEGAKRAGINAFQFVSAEQFEKDLFKVESNAK